MSRKKWSAKTDVTPDLVKFREKRKWQIALRRYVLERNPSLNYAPYFGLDIENMRRWFENQFESDVGWNDFGTKWQFDHIIPVAYFDFSDDRELKLCWNFTNMAIGIADPAKNRGNRIDVLGARAYFSELFEKTGYAPCRDLLQKIVEIESSELMSSERQQHFILERTGYLKKIEAFTASEFEMLNSGRSPEEIQSELDFLSKYTK